MVFSACSACSACSASLRLFFLAPQSQTIPVFYCNGFSPRDDAENDARTVVRAAVVRPVFVLRLPVETADRSPLSRVRAGVRSGRLFDHAAVRSQNPPARAGRSFPGRSGLGGGRPRRLRHRHGNRDPAGRRMVDLDDFGGRHNRRLGRPEVATKAAPAGGDYAIGPLPPGGHPIAVCNAGIRRLVHTVVERVVPPLPVGPGRAGRPRLQRRWRALSKLELVGQCVSCHRRLVGHLRILSFHRPGAADEHPPAGERKVRPISNRGFDISPLRRFILFAYFDANSNSKR